ncbi:helix-hairpin-helix domain-containing protein [Salibacterium sp. K-3]
MNRNLIYTLAAGTAAAAVLIVFLLLIVFRQDTTVQDVEDDEVFWEEKTTAAGPEAGSDAEPENSTDGRMQEVVIDVKGAVVEPGVYELREGSRVIDAIDTAGGMTEEAAPAAVNFAEKLYDEMVVLVPEEGEEQPAAGVQDEGEAKIRVNYAEAAELETLPGIGPAKAAAIIAYREEQGSFEQEEDLLDVSGIGEASLEQMKDKVSLK